MKKQVLALGLLAGVLAVMGTGCISHEASKVGDQVQVRLPVYVKPTIETKSEIVEGKAKVHNLFGLITWGVDSQAVGVCYGTEGADPLLPLPNPNAIARNRSQWRCLCRNQGRSG